MSQKQKLSEMENPNSSDSTDFLDGLYTTEDFSDLRIRCNGVYFQTHQVVVCAASRVLRDMVEGDPGSYYIRLDGEEISVVIRMLAALYTRDYGDFYPSIECEDMDVDAIPCDTVPEAEDEVVQQEYEDSEFVQEEYEEDELVQQEYEEGEFVQDEQDRFRANSETPTSTLTMMPEAESDVKDEVHQKLDVGPSIEDRARCFLAIHAKVYLAAGRYGIPRLQALAKDKFKVALDKENWDSKALVKILESLYNEPEASTKKLRKMTIEATSSYLQKALMLLHNDTKTSTDPPAQVMERLNRWSFPIWLKQNAQISVDLLNELAVETTRQAFERKHKSLKGYWVGSLIYNGNVRDKSCANDVRDRETLVVLSMGDLKKLYEIALGEKMAPSEIWRMEDALEKGQLHQAVVYAEDCKST